EASPGDMDTSVGPALRHFIPIHGNLNRLVQLNLSTSIAEYNPRLTDCGRKIERLFTFVEHFDGALALAVGAEGRQLVISRCRPGFFHAFHRNTHVRFTMWFILMQHRQRISWRI